MLVTTEHHPANRCDGKAVNRPPSHEPISSWGSAVLRIAHRTSLAFLIAAAPIVALNIATPAAYGQASSSSDAAGKVTDPTGATVPGAMVHLINNGTKAERTTRTNDSGDWSIPNVPPANYSIRVEKQGFKTSVIPALDIEIGKTANGSVMLSVGGTEETVEVSTLPPQLQTQEATIGQVIDQKQINDLPINGRNVLQLATLAPGVSPAQTGQTGAPAQTGTRQLYITVDGGRGSSTNYVLDGTYVRSIRFNNMSLQPGVDTLQEFNLLRSTFSTEYGQGQAVVSMVTKSGSNKFHGSGYEFARNAVFDARGYFQPAYNAAGVFTAKPDFYRHQFGGTVGFPIIKDKLFMFGGYEGQRSARTSQSYALYPTLNELNGNWDAVSSQALPNPTGNAAYGNIAYNKQGPAGFTVTSRAATVLNPTYPSVTSDATVLNSNSSNYQGPTTFRDTYDQFTIRGDFNLTQKNSLFGRYVNFDSNQLSPNLIGSGTANPLLGRNAVLGHTWLVTSKIVNEVRIGWNEFYNITLGTLTNQGPGGSWAAAEGLGNLTSNTSPRQNGRAGFTIANFGNVGDGAGDQGGHENIISIGDSLSVSLGTHTVKVGFQGQNRRLWQIADNNARGGATFDNCTPATYAAGYRPTGPDDTNNVTSQGNCAPGTKTYQLAGTTYWYNKFQNYARGMCTSACNGNAGTTLGHYRDNTYGAFINDVWQIGHGLTINAGMRWEYNSPFVEQNGLEGTLDPGTGKVTFTKLPAVIPATYLPYIDTTRTYSPGIVQPQRKGFMPRFGVAYQMNPGTVIRAGYGIYIENLNTNELQFTRYAAPLYYQQAFTNAFTNNLFPDPTKTTGQLPSPFSIFPNNTRPLTQEWNLSLQQDLGRGVLLEMAYTGSNTHHLWKRYDQNMYIQYPFIVPTTFVRPYPQFGQGVLTSTTLGGANFNGGSIKIEQRTKKGLYYLGSYQWSKNLDNISGEAGANDSSYATTTAFDHSYSNFDTRNRAVISGGYELPFGKGKAFLQDRVSSAILGGWSFQPAIQLRTGYPFNIGGSGCSFAANIGCRVFLAPGRTVASSYKANRGISNWFDPTAFSNDPNVATVCPAGTTCKGGVASSGATISDQVCAATSSTNTTPYCSLARPLANMQGWVTRNVGRGPGTVSFDLSAIKTFRVRERLNLQFRAEAYNVINHGIFSNPNAGIGTPATVGKITGTSMDNRSIQLAIKGTF
jgi:hypothetical protein